MSGITDFLFGTTESPSVQSTSTLTGGQENLLKQLTDLLSGQLGEGVESYPGTTTAPLSGLETQSSDVLSQLLSGLSGGSVDPTAIEAINKIMAGTQGTPGAVSVPGVDVPGAVSVSPFESPGAVDVPGVSVPGAVDVSAFNVPGQTDVGRFDVQGYDVGEFDPTAIQDWYKNSLVNPALSTWEKDVVPLIQEKYIGQNAGSSGATNRAIAGSAEDLMTNLNSILADKLLSEKGAFDTRKYESGMDLVNKIFQEATGARDLGVSTGESAAERLQQAGLTTQGLEFQSGTDFVNNLLNELQTARNLGVQTGENAATREQEAGLTTQGLNFQADTDFVNNLLNELQTARNLGVQTGESAAGREYQAGQNDLDRLLNIPGLSTDTTTSFINNLLNVAGATSEAGATERGVTQAGLTEEFQKWLTEQGYNNPWLLNFLTTALGTNATENVVNPGSQTSGAVQDIAVPIISAMLMSSRRHKKNITPIGEKINGLQPVEFEYTDEALKQYPHMTGKGRNVGFLAEDVAEKYPEAVIFDSIGRPDAINYGKLFNIMGI